MFVTKENSRESSRFTRNSLLLCALALLSLDLGTVRGSETPVDATITVDASQVDRNLVYSSITLAQSADSTVLLYPKWIPGAHGPTGPIENLAGFRPTDQTGTPLTWSRDYVDPFRFIVTGPPDHGPITVNMRYISGQPTSLSWGADLEGASTMAVINWNPVTVYPEGVPVREMTVRPALILPSGWSYATAMPVEEQRGDTVLFGEVTFEELIDFPVLCGMYMKSYNIAVTPSASYYVHVAVDSDELLPLADSAFANMKPLVREAEALFGRTHFNEYHFLVAVCDSMSHYGLEHRNSSVNACGRTALTEYGRGNYFIQWVLPHEFVHSWCGKYRRPAGMSTPDYQQPKRMRQLWIYEGLTQYLGELLSVRSGLVSRDYYYGQMSVDWGRLKLQAGREWRSLSDIGLSTQTVWHNSKSWSFYRRRADYYDEGALLWLEVDCRIREATDGRRSLDDFCRSFFGAGDPDAHSVPYDLSDVVAQLNNYADFNFDSLFNVRIGGVSEKLDLTPVTIAGWSLEYGTTKPQALENNEKSHECRYYYESLGLAVTNDGLVQQIIPHSPADNAGLSTGMNIFGINGYVFSIERLEQALDDSMASGTVALLVSHGDLIREAKVPYDGGLRYFVLRRRDGLPDRLRDIVTPRVQVTAVE